MSGACAYAVSTRCFAACRTRALELSGLFSPVHALLRTDLSEDLAMRPEELNKCCCPLFACRVLRVFTPASVEALLP
jgi:hypothetical protein